MNRRHLVLMFFAIQLNGLSIRLIGQSPPIEPKQSGKSMKPFDLDKLKSANEAPQIESRTFHPSFNETFDFQEQSRVAGAINDLCKNWSEELWFDLVSRSEDSSYCMTTHRPSAPGAKNWTVGDVCEELAYLQLTRALDEVRSSLSTEDLTKGKRPYGFNLFGGRSLKDWVELHSFKRFDAALTQTVASALSEIANDEKLTSDKRQKAVEALKREHLAVSLVEGGLSRVCFPWEKYSLVTKKSSR